MLVFQKKAVLNLILVCLCVSVCVSCESDDDGSLRADAIAIKEVIAPESLQVGRKATFIIVYDRPGSCHGFLRFDQLVGTSSLQVRLVAGVFGNNCTTVNEAPREIPFEFTPQSAGTLSVSFEKNPDAGNGELITFEFEVLPE